MGSDPSREPPSFFQKPTDAIQNVAPEAVADHPYPTLTGALELMGSRVEAGRSAPAELARLHLHPDSAAWATSHPAEPLPTQPKARPPM
jgi:fumarylpyruvate hydrolase